ncbi:hypothetical protein LCGC14_0519450 [marine sediment metagenome]|uniref:Uncharacterized protein n=1 Tax=marine sediment metagenome TaxID=412755 RepID=A0A0F9RYZ6_9ZZZZ|nr:MAG: hypothetical protein Lokiarch_48510 [Candidatus Lokiarchaeum sp. GC14_75]
MKYFRFSCDTNILISSTFYYRFKTFPEIFREGRVYDFSIFIMRFFEYYSENKRMNFGILTPSTLKELNYIKPKIILKKLEEEFSNNQEKFMKAINELSSLLNKVNDNLKRVLKVFDIGKAYFNDSRVKKIYKKVDNMYKNFMIQSKNMKEDIKKRVEGHINNFVAKYFQDMEALQEIEEAKETALQTQIIRLSKKNKAIKNNDKEILSEIIYERKRCIQEKTFFRNNLDFYFITEDTHFSRKYIRRFNFYSTPITTKIKNLFDIDCVRAKQFARLLIDRKLNFEK